MIFFMQKFAFSERKERPMVYHIMADGTMREDISGYVVQNEEVYEIIRRVNERLKAEAQEKH